MQIVLGRFSSRVAVNAASVRDIFLDNLPLVNLGFVIVGGAIILWVFAAALLIIHPRYLLFSLKAIALYIISRAFFFSLTHIGPYPLAYSPDRTIRDMVCIALLRSRAISSIPATPRFHSFSR